MELTELKKLNKWLGDLGALRSNNTPVQKNVVREIDSEGEQGASGESYEIYKLTEEVYVELAINTDSYGYNEFVAGLKFVTPVEKVVTKFE